MPYFTESIFLIGSYCFGSILFAVWIARLCGLPDPRTLGSRNPGASNVIREHGRWAGAVVLAADILKGLVPVWIARQIGFDDTMIALVGGCAYLGHVFPLYHRFRGGKGVATLFGCVAGFDLISAGVAVMLWGLATALTRYVSVGSIFVSLVIPILLWQSEQSLSLIMATALMGLITIVKHRDNITRLRARQEIKIG